MNYTGRLYGKSHGRTYFPLVLTSEDVDAMERELKNLRQRVTELEIVADLAAGLSTSQDCDPAHHGLVCAAVTALNHPTNATVQATTSAPCEPENHKQTDR